VHWQQVEYRYHQLSADRLQFVARNDGDEVLFNRGADGQRLDGPEPRYCNLKLALGRVLHASGAADMINKMCFDDDDDIFLAQPSYFGGPFVPVTS
jgi:hypothetical protein